MSEILRKRRQTSSTASLPLYNTNTNRQNNPQNQIFRVRIASGKSYFSSLKATHRVCCITVLFCFTILGIVSYYHSHHNVIPQNETTTNDNNDNKNHRKVFSSIDDKNSMKEYYYSNPHHEKDHIEIMKRHENGIKNTEKETKTYHMRGNHHPRHKNIFKDNVPSSSSSSFKEQPIIHHPTRSKTKKDQNHELVDSSLLNLNNNQNNENENNDNIVMVVCPNGSKGILNDDYCDCEDGSDEHITSACSNILVQNKLFTCDNGTKSIFLSRVKDGVSDCLDGTDEI